MWWPLILPAESDYHSTADFGMEDQIASAMKQFGLRPNATWSSIFKRSGEQLYRETAEFVVDNQDQVIPFKYDRSTIMHQNMDGACTLCKEILQTVDHIVGSCTKLVAEEKTIENGRRTDTPLMEERIPPLGSPLPC